MPTRQRLPVPHQLTQQSPTDQLRRLSADKVILIPERLNPIIADRIVWYGDPTFKAMIAGQKGPPPYPDPRIGEVDALLVSVGNRPPAAKQQSTKTALGAEAAIQAASPDMSPDDGPVDPVEGVEDLKDVFVDDLEPTFPSFTTRVAGNDGRERD